VDEKNLDEEIAKIKDKLSSKIAERQKAQTNTRRPHDDDDLFAEPTARAISGRDIEELSNTTRRQRPTQDDDDLMMIDARPPSKSTARKRTVREISDDDDDDVEEISAAATKKRRTTSAQTRRTPARGAASRAKKVHPYLRKNN